MRFYRLSLIIRRVPKESKAQRNTGVFRLSFALFLACAIKLRSISTCLQAQVKPVFYLAKVLMAAKYASYEEILVIEKPLLIEYTL